MGRSCGLIVRVRAICKRTSDNHSKSSCQIQGKTCLLQSMRLWNPDELFFVVLWMEIILFSKFLHNRS